MRPLKLTMRSFGPFIGEQMVDFTRYGDNAFLLIHGPTGAGKTTILDGICYALYGDPSGEKRDEHYLRSQRAAAEALCEVEFLFQVGPRRFHIKRTPPQTIQQKGKPREIKHLVEFCQVDQQGAVIGERSSKVGEVRQKVEEVLGFSSEQFRQVVVLPQGEFRKLLLAKSDEKEQILEKLFGTGRFKLLELSLKNRRTTLGGELKELKAAVEGILTSNKVASIQELEQQITALEARRQELSGQLAVQSRLQQQADRQLQEAQALASRFNERDQSRTVYETLATQKEAMDQLAARSELANRALNLVDLDDLIAKTGKDLGERTLELTALGETISALAGQQQTVQQQLQQARTAADQVPALTVEKTRLEAQLQKIRELESGCLRLEQARKAELVGRRAVEKCNAMITTREERLAALTISIESLSQSNGQVGQLQAQVEQLAKLKSARHQLENDTQAKHKLELELQTAIAAVTEAEQQQQELQTGYEDLQQHFVAGQAALLVRELAAGKPCPVCGSPDHPKPAQSAGDVPTDKELEKVRKQVAEAASRHQRTLAGKSDLQVQSGALAAGIQKLQEQLGVLAEQPLSAVIGQQQELVQKLVQAETAGKELEDQRLERTQLQAALVQDKEKRVQAETAYGLATAELEGQRAVVASLVKEAGQGDAVSVSQRITTLDEQCSKAQAALHKADTRAAAIETQLSMATGQQSEKQILVSRLETELAKQKRSFGIRLDTEGFATERGWREARLPRPEIEKNQKAVQHYAQNLAAAQERLARAEGSCTGLECPDLAAVQAAKAQADQQLGVLQKETGLLEAAQNGLKAALATIGEKGARMTQLEQEYAVAGRLADLVGGQNPKRMTLQRYVLAALFEEVAIAASQRLTRMSQGRYHLVRSEAPRDGKSTSGLDLDVTDDYSGEKRPAFTLSGGESFLASLSLALGLSDVVLAQSGGRYLDCIFIDEGFGSLDGETLDFALTTLIELHRAGRVIGIISHVAELKERIQSRLEVVSTKEGSRIVAG
jgi:DNA repair protein SbcC/Rad50